MTEDIYSWAGTGEDSESDLISAQAYPVFIMQDSVKIRLNGIDKIISIKDFLESLDASIVNRVDTELEGIALPPNVFYLAHTSVKMQISCYYPECIQNISYTGCSTPRASVIPNVIISHVLGKSGGDWVIDYTKYFCTNRSVPDLPRTFINSVNHSRGVFLLPFTNTYSDGKMCYGNNTMPKRFAAGNLRGLNWYYQYLFDSPFNDDLGVSAIYPRPAPADWYRNLAKLAEEGKSFPYSQLSGFESSQPQA